MRRDAMTIYKRHLGRRGILLGLLGAIWVLQGVGVIFTPASESYWLLAHGAGFRAAAWVATGLVAIAYAGRPQGDDAPGFLALYVMAGFRIVSYGIDTVRALLPGDDGNARGLIGVLAWLTVLTVIIVISGWSEPEETP